MIAIGVGLFLGTGERLSAAGPALIDAARHELRRRAPRRVLPRLDPRAVDFRLPGAPVTTWICTVSLVAVALYVMPDFSSANWYYNLVAGVLMLVGTNVGYEIGRRRLARNGLPDLGEGADD